jgi:hypothetical protein
MHGTTPLLSVAELQSCTFRTLIMIRETTLAKTLAPHTTLHKFSSQSGHLRVIIFSFLKSSGLNRDCGSSSNDSRPLPWFRVLVIQCTAPF